MVFPGGSFVAHGWANGDPHSVGTLFSNLILSMSYGGCPGWHAACITI